MYSNRAIRNREWIRLTIDRSQLWNQWLDVLITHKGRQFEMFNGQPCFLTVSTEITNHFEFTFEQTYVQRLPAPFESNCVHYVDQYDCLNRAHCVDTCLANRTLHAKHFWPFQLETIDAGFDLSNVKFEPDDAYNAFRSECSQRYTQPDCKSTQHIAYLNRIEMCEPTDPKLESQEQFTFDTDDMEMEGNASVYMYDGLAWMDEPMTTWLADANETATDEPLNELDMINGDRETNDEENNSNDAEMTEPMAVIENTPINTDCGSRHVTISVKFSSEFTTRMVYVPIFDSMQLIGNVGQAVSVYLGLCLYDIHRLMSAYVGCMRRRRHRPRPVRSAAVRTLRFDS